MASANDLGPSSSSSPPSPTSSTAVPQRIFSFLARMLNWPWRWMGGRADPDTAELVSRWGVTAEDAASLRRVEPTKEFVRYLACLYIYNAPEEDLRNFSRIIFLIEAAHWHYLDNYVEKYKCLKEITQEDFTCLMFESCDFLKPYSANFDEIYKKYILYRDQITVCGAVILNATYDKCLLVYGTSWGFPKGKRSKNEKDHQCAIREVLEEVGFDITEILSERRSIQLVYRRQRTRLYIIPGVNEDTKFATRSVNEINAISWCRVDEVGERLSKKNKILLIFLRQWIAENAPPNASHISSRGDEDVEEEPEHESVIAIPSEPVMKLPPLPDFLVSKDTERQLSSKKEMKKMEVEELEAVLAEMGNASQDEANGGETSDKKPDEESGDGEKKEIAPAHSESKTRKKKKKKKSRKEMDAAAIEAAARSAKVAAAKKKEKKLYNR